MKFLTTSLPLFLEQFSVALPPLFIDWIRVQNAQTDYDKTYRGGGYQQF